MAYVLEFSLKHQSLYATYYKTIIHAKRKERNSVSKSETINYSQDSKCSIV